MNAEKSSPDIALEMQGVSKRFGATVALDGVDLTLKKGEVHALVGENGAGKSTLMKILSGAHQANAGKMRLFGRAYQPSGPLEARRLGVAMIYQELSLAPHLTVQENIFLGAEHTTKGVFLDREKMRDKTREVLAQFDHPEIKPETQVLKLSQSAQQLVEIARALSAGCQILVFDEPTSSLAQQDIQRLFEIIRQLQDKGLSIIYISHFLEEVQEIADRVTILRDGRAVGTHEINAISTDDVVRAMVGREIEALYPRSSRTRGEKLLQVSNLAGFEKPIDASLELYRGEVLGICGLVGAGRTEFLRALFGLDPVVNGEIRIGLASGIATPRKRWQQGAGMLSESRKEEGLAINLSIAENVTLSKLHGFGPSMLVLPGKQNESTQFWIDELDIRCENPAQAVENLSGGNQQKAALARLLQHDVDILLLDEPTRGVDVAAKAKIYEVIDAIVSGKDGRTPKAVLMVSSYLPELLGVCDRIAVMSRGKLLQARPVEEMDEHQLMLAATGQSSE